MTNHSIAVLKSGIRSARLPRRNLRRTAVFGRGCRVQGLSAFRCL